MARSSHLPARFPPFGAWPAMMRADMAAAFFDFEDTAALYRAMARGEAPKPSEVRHRGQAREPVWSVEACRKFIARRDEAPEDEMSLASLI